MGTLQFIRDRLLSLGAGREIDPAREPLRQHEELHVQLVKTQHVVADRANDVKRGRWVGAARRACLRELVKFEVAVLQHFLFEEEGGLADVLQVAPRYFDRAETLLAQHATLAKELGAIRELAEICGRSPERWSELESRLASFARKFESHEHAENEISSRAFLDDIGTPG
jgi:hypothetical protein